MGKWSCQYCGKDDFKVAGARNGHQWRCRTKAEAKNVKVEEPKQEATKQEDLLVTVNVNPPISINGKTYAGIVRVNPGKANTLKGMMQKHKDNEKRVGIFIAHPDMKSWV